MPTNEERMIRCLLADIHEPLNLLFPGIRVEAQTRPLGWGDSICSLVLRVWYVHPKLGHLEYLHEVPLMHLEAWGHDGLLQHLMNEIPRRVLDGMLREAQKHSQRNWYSK
ncbi:hypothetical protein PhageSB_005 [Pseudomonas phage vB_PaeA_SB]|nr:hypothetical protein PhageSB_005 [Pseudomonas phage vB_PaeA_SB]